jgi:hypothetical protein
MALPDFDEFKENLSRAKREDQSWGDLFKEVSGGQFKYDNEEQQNAKIYLAKSSIIHALSDWSFYSSPFLDKAAADYSVKSWQLTEYVESLRESLSISESDLIIYENYHYKQSSQEAHGEQPSNAEQSLGATEQVYGQKSTSLSNNTADRQSRIYQDSQADGSRTSPSKVGLGPIGLASAILVFFIALIISVSSQKPATRVTPLANNPNSLTIPSSGSNTTNPQNSPPKTPEDKVYFKGIDLPVTNKLCNKKGTFCIYDLAVLVSQESGEATYSYSDVSNGEQVNINGTITVSNIERNDGNRSYTFAFRDDQSNTTPGWAAAGYFNLEQGTNPSKPGILARFKTTESFGPKTPVGLENTSYLFPN